MGCDIVKKKQLIEAAKKEYKKLAKLKKQGKGSPEIQAAMDNMHAIAQNRPDKINVSKDTETTSYGFTEAYSEKSRVANKFVTDLSISVYDDADSWLSPRLKKFHEEKMKTNGVYKTVYNTIKDGMDDIKLIDKIAQTLFLTGDTSREKIAQLTKLVEEVNRWANDVLTDEMPQWDKKLLKAIPDEKDQRTLTEVYGLSGYGAIYQYKVDGKRVSEWLNEGHSIPYILKKMGPISESDNTMAKELMDRLVNQKVQESKVTNAGFNQKVEALVVLKTMSANSNAGYKMHKRMRTEHNELHKKLEELAISAYAMNDVVNKGIGKSSAGDASNRTYTDYDGHGLLDLYSNSHELKVLTKAEMQHERYTSSMSPWKVLKKPVGNGPGIVIRRSQKTYQKGLGVNTDRIKNGLHVDKDYAEMNIANDKDWLVKNNIQEYETQTGNKVYRMILTKQNAIDAEGMNNVMQSLYRSIVHNAELSKHYGLQKSILSNFTEHVGKSKGKLFQLEKKILRNKKLSRDKRAEVKPYLDSEFSMEEIQKIAPNVAKEYKVASGVTTYGGLNNKLKYVRVGLSDMLVGFQSTSVISEDWPWLQDVERKYKQLVVLKKLKMVVASPSKLMADIVSNAAILMSLDVDPVEGGQDMKAAYNDWNETSKMESMKIKLEMELISAESSKDENRVKRIKLDLDRLNKKFESHEFYDAYKYGFVQSLASSMMIKEYDTISGLQHTIDEVVKKFTENDKHKPNEVHDAIVWWMNAGYGLENILEYGANKAKKYNTDIGDEIMAMADRLKNKKEKGNEDVAGYISEIIAGPESELVRQGSRVMQMGDLSARWALYKHTIKEMMREDLGRRISRDEVNAMVKGKFPMEADKMNKLKEAAAMRALDTFVDYRLNIPVN